jgi:outer membrane protein assembly factor BamB
MKKNNYLENKKNAAIAIALLLLLSMISLAIYVPNVKAATTDVTTYPYISVTPNPAGVSQTVQITMWLSMTPPQLNEVGTRDVQKWHNYTVTVTAPNGHTETLGPFNSEATGSTYTQYTPDQIGNYTFQFSFAGERKNGTEAASRTYIDLYYKPSTTRTSLTVQSDPISNYPTWPLPTDYWTRPIQSENRLWGTIGGNWLLPRYTVQSNAYAPYTTAPNTAHIVWTKELTFGGIAGGETGETSYFEGHVYSNHFAPPVIISGRLYYNDPNPPAQGFHCVDLRTGEDIYYSNSSSNPTGGMLFWMSNGGTGGITCGQIVGYNSINQHGTFAFLWSLSNTVFTMYDAFTGNAIVSFTNVSSSTSLNSNGPVVTSDENGNIIYYILDGTNNWLLKWNSSRALYGAVDPQHEYTNRGAIPKTLDWTRGIQWNVTVPDIPGTQVFISEGGSNGAALINDEVILATNLGSQTPTYDGQFTQVAYSAVDGHRLWVQNRTAPIGSTNYNTKGPISDGVYCMFNQHTMEWTAYDINTGNLKWGPTEAYSNPWGMYGGDSTAAAYGTLYASAYDGMIHAYNITNGKHLWDFSTGSSGLETAYGTYPFYGLAGGLTVADGKLYQGSSEHSSDNPLWRGGGLYCVNASTGDLVWKIQGYYWTPVIADGYLAVANGADNRIYCFGKGQTATTVSASPETSVNGNSVLITGTVLDQSPGAKGTAAIADEYQTPWMEYLYMQRAMPTNATGVPVTLSVVDANGNYREIGQTTSDAKGFYSFNWTPDIEGKYAVYASFAGSESYWSSNAETAFYVSAPPQATAQPTPIAQSVADVYFVPATIGLLLAIIIVGIATVLALKKRP